MIVSSYSCIDASTGEYQEEEGFYPEEEEHFDHLNHQGKLKPLQVLLLQANILAKCKALLEQGTLTNYFMLHDPIPSFILTSFYFDYYNLLL